MAAAGRAGVVAAVATQPQAVVRPVRLRSGRV